MPDTIGDLQVELSANIDKLKSDLKKAEAQANTAGKRIARNMQGAFRGVGNIRVKLGLVAFALGQIAALGGLNKLVKSAIDTADAIGKVSQKLGISTSALQELQFAASQSGVKVESLNMGLQRFGRRAAEAASGTGEARDALAQLGIQLKDSNGTLRSTEDLFMDSMKALSKIENPLERVRLGFKMFDAEGVSIVNMSENVGELRLQAQKLGIVLDDEVVASATKTKDEMEALAQVTKGNLAPALTDLGGRALVTVYGSMAEVAKWANSVYIAFAKLENLGLGAVETKIENAGSRLEELKARLEELGPTKKPADLMSGSLSDWFSQETITKAAVLQSAIAGVEAELEKLVARRDKLKGDRESEEEAAAAGRSREQAEFKTEAQRKKDRAEHLKGVELRKKVEKDAHVAWQEMMGHEKQMIRDKAKEKIDSLRHAFTDEKVYSEAVIKIQEVEAAEIKAIDDEEADRKKQFLDTLHRQYLRATGQRITLIEEDLAAELAALDEKFLGTDAYQNARVELEAIANAKIRKLRNEDLEDQKKANEDKKEEWEDLYDFMEDGFNDALATMLLTGEFTFKQLAQSFLREFVQRGLEKVDWAGLLGSVANIFSTGSGVVGGISKNPSTNYSIYTGTPPRATGGAVGGGGPLLIGERGPELFMPGKSGFIATNWELQNMSRGGGGGGNVTVNVVNNSGQPSTTTEKDGPNGSRNIEVMIGSAISKNIQRGGEVDKAIRDSYGVQRVGRHGI